MHKRTYAVMRCVCVRVSVTFVSCIKTNTDIFEFFYHRVAKSFWFFHAKRDGDIPTGASNACGVGKKTQFWMNIWLRCIQVYSVVNRTSREV